MKYLNDIPELDLLARALNFEAPGVKVASRVEAYTIKPLARDRALFKRLDAELQADIDLTCPPRQPLSSSTVVPLHNSVFGPLERRENRKTLWLLIGTLNLAYPDHDFTALSAGDFVREASARTVLVQLSTALGHLRHAASTYVSSSSPPKFSTSLSSLSSSAGSATDEPTSATPSHPVLRQVLDPIIDLDDCEVYSYAPDFDSDPHNGESDSEDAESEDEACGGDDEGMAWPMDGFATPRLHRRRSIRAARPTPSPVLPKGMSNKRSRSMASLSESTGGLLWSSNYFFLNRKRKRLLFVSLWARATDSHPYIHLHQVVALPPGKRQRA